MDTFIILSFLTCLVDAPGLLHYFQLLFPSMSHRKGLAPSQQLFHSKPSFSSDFIASSFCIIISFCIHLYKAHILIKVDIFCSKSVNELLMVRWKIGRTTGMTRKRSDMVEFLNGKIVFAKITEKCTEVQQSTTKKT